MTARRRWLPFRAVNRRGSPGHDPSVQRHHLLPRQLLSRQRLVLNRKDPLGAGYDFTALDAMAEQLWTQT